MICTNFLGRQVTQKDQLGKFIVIYHGIGVKRAKIFCCAAGLPYNYFVSKLEIGKVNYLESLVESVCLKEYELKRQVKSNLYFKYTNSFFSGLRMSQGLPSRSQRTKTNAQTAKKNKIDFTKFSK